MGLSQKAIGEFKEIYKKEFGKELSDAEASEASNNLVNLVDLLIKCHARDMERKHRLKKEPKGFHINDGIYECGICRYQIEGEKTWYDKWGLKCLICQKAIDTGAIPGFACENRESWYRMWELKDSFGISSPTARKLIRQGKLAARIVAGENSGVHEYVFLKKENIHLVDPDKKDPVIRSYHRHQKKITDIRTKELMREQRVKFEKMRKKWKLKNR